MLQDDKDLVHEFVSSDGLDCLIKVGTEADQNHQNYILRGKCGIISAISTIVSIHTTRHSKTALPSGFMNLHKH